MLVLLEHDPVVTLGRGASDEHLKLPPAEFSRRGIDLVRTSRGGEVTYHGPGQLVGYPVFHLDCVGCDLHLYLRMLEEVLIVALCSLQLEGRRIEGKTGVWIADEKIASLGVGVRRWVSWHGFALNVQNQQDGFSTIVPCGLSGVRMTSLEEQLGAAPPMENIREIVLRAFAQVFPLRYEGSYENSSQEKT